MSLCRTGKPAATSEFGNGTVSTTVVDCSTLDRDTVVGVADEQQGSLPVPLAFQRVVGNRLQHQFLIRSAA